MRSKPWYLLLVCLLLVGSMLLAQSEQSNSLITPEASISELTIAPTTPLSSSGNSKKAGDLSKSSSRKVAPDPSFEYLNNANKIAKNKPDSAISLIQQALKSSFAYKNRRAEAYCYNSLGAIYYQLDQFDLSINNYERAINIFRELKDEDGLYSAYKYIGMAYDAKGDTDKALEKYFIFLNKAEEKKNMDDKVVAQSCIGRLYFNDEKYDLALERYQDVLHIEQARDNDAGVIAANGSIGKVYEQMNNDTAAIGAYNTSWEVAKINPDFSTNVSGNNSYYRNVSDVYGKRKNYKKQEEYQQQAIAYNKRVGNKEEENNFNLELAQNYLNQQRSGEAIPYLKNSINLSTQLGQLESKSKALEALSIAYERSGEYEKALDNYKQYVALNDSLIQENNRQTLAALEMTRSIYQKDQQIKLLEKDMTLREEKIKSLEKDQALKDADLKRQQYISLSLVAGLMVILFSSAFVIRSYRQKRKANLLLTLKSLRSQMNPHFIFNSLNSVNSFISKNDDRSANKYLSDFSKLMRAVMENSNYEFVSLTSELEILKLYMSLEHFRFKDKFDYTLEVDPDIDTDSFEIPPMLVQPYIENAVWHGLRYKDTIGNLSVKFRQQDDQLLAVIEDNGIGRKKSQELKTKNQKEHNSTGLKNIEERLHILNELHKTQLKVLIEDLFDGQGEGAGTRVVIHIPHNKVEV